MTAKISLHHVGKQFLVRPTRALPQARVLQALEDITLDVQAGQFLTIV